MRRVLAVPPADARTTTGAAGAAVIPTPAPGAWTTYDGERLKLAPLTLTDQQLPAGEVAVGKSMLLVGTGTHAVRLGDVQAVGKKQMPAADWARGLRLESGFVLGAS